MFVSDKGFEIDLANLGWNERRNIDLSHDQVKLNILPSLHNKSVHLLRKLTSLNSCTVSSKRKYLEEKILSARITEKEC